MKIAIIGCGYVGSAIARYWHQTGHQVTVTTTTKEKVPQLADIASEVVIVVGNDPQSVEQLVSGQDLILLSVGAKQRTVDNYRLTYLDTAKNVIAAIEKSSQVKQLIYTSSYAVLGDKNGQLTDETAPVAPANEYGEILAAAESLLLSISSEEFKVCLFRLAGIYGPGRELIKIFRNWAGTTRPGKGDDYSNWIHLDDIVGAIEFARAKELGGIYNLTGDRPLATKEFFARLFATHQLPLITWDETQPSSRPYNAKLSNQKLKTAGFSFKHPEIVF